jgi:hypothetical protein
MIQMIGKSTINGKEWVNQPFLWMLLIVDLPIFRFKE